MLPVARCGVDAMLRPLPKLYVYDQPLGVLLSVAPLGYDAGVEGNPGSETMFRVTTHDITSSILFWSFMVKQSDS